MIAEANDRLNPRESREWSAVGHSCKGRAASYVQPAWQTPSAGSRLLRCAQLDDTSVGPATGLAARDLRLQGERLPTRLFEPANLPPSRQSPATSICSAAVDQRELHRFDAWPRDRPILETEVAVWGWTAATGWVVLTLPARTEWLHRRPAEPRHAQGRAAYHPAAREETALSARSHARGGASRPTLAVEIGGARPGPPGAVVASYGVYPQFGLLQGRVVRFRRRGHVVRGAGRGR